jgi:hypothetical protein
LVISRSSVFDRAAGSGWVTVVEKPVWCRAGSSR